MGDAKLPCVAGVVMGCPSDSPDDYTALNELKAKPKLREKFHVQDAWVEFDVSTITFTARDCFDLPGVHNQCGQGILS